MECVWTSSSDEIMDSTGDRLEERQSEGGRERIKQSAAKCCKIGDAAGARKQLTNRHHAMPFLITLCRKAGDAYAWK